MDNSQSESPHRKRFRDDNPTTLSSPEQGSNKKKKRKNKDKNKNMEHGALIPQDPPPSTEPNEKGTERSGQLHVCPNPNRVTPGVATETPIAAEKERGAEPNGVAAEHSVSDSTPPKSKRRKKKKRNVPLVYYDFPNALQVSAVQTQVCHEHELAALAETPVPADPEQKLSKRKRRKMKRKGVLKNEVAEPAQYNGEPTEIPVQRSMCAIGTSHADQTIPTDQKLSIDSATPIVPKQKMSKRQRRKKCQIALKSRRSESDKHNTESTAEIPVQRPQGFEITSAVPFKSNGETSVSEGNVEQPGNTQVQRTKGLEVTKIPFKWHGEDSVRCLSCQQRGHKFTNCPRVKHRCYNEEICFFCGEIGHTLAKCSVSRAGGRFARCLFCYAHGHFTNKCPWNGHGIDRKVVAANGPVDKAVEA